MDSRPRESIVERRFGERHFGKFNPLRIVAGILGALSPRQQVEAMAYDLGEELSPSMFRQSQGTPGSKARNKRERQNRRRGRLDRGKYG